MRKKYLYKRRTLYDENESSIVLSYYILDNEYFKDVLCEQWGIEVETSFNGKTESKIIECLSGDLLKVRRILDLLYLNEVSCVNLYEIVDEIISI